MPSSITSHSKEFGGFKRHFDETLRPKLEKNRLLNLVIITALFLFLTFLFPTFVRNLISDGYVTSTRRLIGWIAIPFLFLAVVLFWMVRRHKIIIMKDITGFLGWTYSPKDKKKVAFIGTLLYRYGLFFAKYNNIVGGDILHGVYNETPFVFCKLQLNLSKWLYFLLPDSPFKGLVLSVKTNIAPKTTALISQSAKTKFPELDFAQKYDTRRGRLNLWSNDIANFNENNCHRLNAALSDIQSICRSENFGVLFNDGWLHIPIEREHSFILLPPPRCNAAIMHICVFPLACLHYL